MLLLFGKSVCALQAPLFVSVDPGKTIGVLRLVKFDREIRMRGTLPPQKSNSTVLILAPRNMRCVVV